MNPGSASIKYESIMAQIIRCSMLLLRRIIKMFSDTLKQDADPEWLLGCISLGPGCPGIALIAAKLQILNNAQ
jgi:hypothetical protein